MGMLGGDPDMKEGEQHWPTSPLPLPPGKKVDAASSAIRELTIAGKFCSGTKPSCNKATALQNSPSAHGGGTQILPLCEAQKKKRKHFGHQSCNMRTP
ncbi:hypothetical protein Anapl_02795 [Anas platyrhynchos]|uniref:Uncharacterized protein n=1 Tax=Anas platyrhynchos TaxID=8839 RepID=R0K3J6_ANAPL|nr:hypothetical protein Anapl_02795 [Anas platyrhynchos]